ncbi:MAG: hypothetical protein NT069_17265, partial [Planctomycetota bacterium]|nr:hypothetical protein [Planctomycetota bacterium]
PEGLPFRAWVPGCATGEEAFTVAICLREALERLGRSMEIQIFGTDLDSQAIEAARVGQYSEGISRDVTAARLERFFTPQDGGYRIHKNLRELVVFAPQNVIKDPPFTKLDFLSCRNLLIYLNSDLQKRLLPVFHYALKPGGLLLLGPSETIGPFNDLFETVDKRWKIYRRKESAASNRRLSLFAVSSHLAPAVESNAGELPAALADQRSGRRGLHSRSHRGVSGAGGGATATQPARNGAGGTTTRPGGGAAAGANGRGCCGSRTDPGEDERWLQSGEPHGNEDPRARADSRIPAGDVFALPRAGCRRSRHASPPTEPLWTKPTGRR